jgi:hypothetical protein
MSNTKRQARKHRAAGESLCASCALECKQPLGAVCLTCPRYVEQVEMFAAPEEGEEQTK